MHTTNTQVTGGASSRTYAPIWRLRCPCGGTVRAERGHTARWVLVCSRCGGGKPLIDRLSVAYNVTPTRVLDGPLTATELPWRVGSARRVGPPERNLTAEEFRLARRHLWNNRQLLAYLRDERGLSRHTVRNSHLGYLQPHDKRPPGIIIPIPAAEPVSYRIRYWPDVWLPPGSTKPVKIATPRGHQQRLYPPRPLGGRTILCEGEFDALITRQHGLRATAVPGCNARASLFVKVGRRCRQVAVCFDRGAEAEAQRAVDIISREGAEAWAVDLGLDAHGADLTDWFTSGRTADDLRELIREACHAR